MTRKGISLAGGSSMGHYPAAQVLLTQFLPLFRQADGLLSALRTNAGLYILIVSPRSDFGAIYTVDSTTILIRLIALKPCEVDIAVVITAGACSLARNSQTCWYLDNQSWFE